MLEIGVQDGRAGTRTYAETQTVVDAVGTLERHNPALRRGSLRRRTQDEASIRTYLGEAVQTLKTLQQQGAFAQDERILLSGAGSAWYDVVADVFAPMKSEVDVVLRPGCYLTCDAGIYRVAQRQIVARNKIAQEVDGNLGDTLLPAIEVWAYVQSVPQPGLAIIGLGNAMLHLIPDFDAGLALSPRRAHCADARARSMVHNQADGPARLSPDS